MFVTFPDADYGRTVLIQGGEVEFANVWKEDVVRLTMKTGRHYFVEGTLESVKVTLNGERGNDRRNDQRAERGP